MKSTKSPMVGKFLLTVALGYLFMPIDIIPDFIPFVGQVDDVVIVPLLIGIALRLIPKEIAKYKNKKNYETTYPNVTPLENN